MATHSSVLAWEIPWTEESDGLQSMGSKRVRHGWVTDTYPFVKVHGHCQSSSRKQSQLAREEYPASPPGSQAFQGTYSAPISRPTILLLKCCVQKALNLMDVVLYLDTWTLNTFPPGLKTLSDHNLFLSIVDLKCCFIFRCTETCFFVYFLFFLFYVVC